MKRKVPITIKLVTGEERIIDAFPIIDKGVSLFVHRQFCNHERGIRQTPFWAITHVSGYKMPYFFKSCAEATNRAHMLIELFVKNNLTGIIKCPRIKTEILKICEGKNDYANK